LDVDYSQHCRTKFPDDRAKRIRDAEKQAAAPFVNVSVVDLTTHICPESPCAVYVDGIVKYSDANHLTTTFSRSLAAPLAAYFADE
jgi:hypothetical protein